MKNIFKSGLLVLSILSTLTMNAQVPQLNSYPSASAVAFLDFDGHTVNGTSWNYNGPIECSGSGLTNTQITEVFNRVAEDFRPFNINITTDSTKYLAAPANKRMRLILTISSSWYGSAGGVAFIYSFTWGDDTPCFVFTALLNYNVKNIAEAASHEIGHTLGLFHQSTYDQNCVKISDYNSGTGTGEIGWAPIMGVGYSRNFTIWHNGANSYGCTSYQDDLSIITTSNGFGYRTDDYSSSFGSATNATFSSNQFTLNGVIEQNTDVDMFKFTMPMLGRIILNAIPNNVGNNNSGSDIDMQVSLYDNSQTLLNVFNPSTLLSSFIDTNLNAGNYYLKIEGKGNMYAPNYASLGAYALAGNFSNSTLPLHKLELKGSVNGDRHQLSWIIEADELVVKQIMEISTNGTNYSPLTQTGNTERSYGYKPTVAKTIQYRLNVTFDDGRQYYSNTVTLRNNGNLVKPELIGNFIPGNTVLVNSPGNFDYAIYNLSGNVINKGRLISGINNINASGIINGMYFIRYTNNEQQWVEKMMRQ